MNGFVRSLIIVLLLWPAAAGCRKIVTPAVPESHLPEEFIPAPSAIIPSELRIFEEPAEPPQPEVATPPEVFVEAERYFTDGNYRQAAQAFEKFLRSFPKAPDRDRALFHLGFSLALSGNDKDFLQTEAALRRLIAEFPRSPYRRQAEWILSLRAQIVQLQSNIKDRDERIQQLSNELNKLKSIDFDRRPSRPE